MKITHPKFNNLCHTCVQHITHINQPVKPVSMTKVILGGTTQLVPTQSTIGPPTVTTSTDPAASSRHCPRVLGQVDLRTIVVRVQASSCEPRGGWKWRFFWIIIVKPMFDDG